jgi:1,2-phenylacetyl-CoA epoxidase catalytic subunit
LRLAESTTDWMPDEYRTSVLRFVEMHANSELMGVPLNASG